MKEKILLMRERLNHASRAFRTATRLHIVLAASIAICVVIALTAQQLNHERVQTIKSVIGENESRVQSFEQYVLRTLEVADLATRHVDYLTSRSALRQSTTLFDADQTIRSPLFTAVIISRGDGAISSTDTAISVSPNTQSRLLALAQKAPGRLTVTAPLPLTGIQPQIAVVRDLPALDSGFVAILIDPRRFTEFADDIPFANEDLISLIGLDGVTRARRTGSLLSAGEVVKGLVMERQMANPNGTYLGPSVLDDIPRYFSHRRLAPFNLFVTSGTPASIVEERVAQRRLVQLGIMAAAIFAILGAALILMNAIRARHLRLSQLTKSVRRLNEAQRLGSMGDWDYFPAKDELHWSENLRRMYSRTDQEAVSSLKDVAQYTDPSRVKRELKRVLDSGEHTSWEIDVTLRSGELSTRRVVAAPIRDEQGVIVGIHGTDQDITHEAKLRTLENRLTELARLDSMRALAATFAHELNQPLGVAANYLGAATRMLASSTPGATKILGYLESTKDQIDHIGQIIGGARELVTHSGSNSQEAAVVEVIDSVIMLIRGSEGGRRVKFQIDTTRGAEDIRANVAQLKQVLFNLSRNAIEAVPADRIPSIDFSIGRNSEGLIQFEITDNGTGFQESGRDPFATLSTTKEGGLGLGLSLSRTIVEAHGGSIWIKRTGMDGTTLAFTLQTGDAVES